MIFSSLVAANAGDTLSVLVAGGDGGVNGVGSNGNNGLVIVTFH
jgi:hypothetical protein